MHTNSKTRGVTRVAALRTSRTWATHASFLLATSMALAACDESPIEPRAKLPTDGPEKPSAVINILPPGQTFPAPIAFVTGSPVGKDAKVQVYDKTGKLMAQFYAFSAAADFTAGVEVTLGDVNGDGFPDIVAGEGPTPGGISPTMYAVWDGRTGTRLAEAPVYWNSFRGGTRVGAGDFDGDGKDEIFACLAPGGANVGGYATSAYVYKVGKGYPYIEFGTSLGDPNTKAWMVGGCHIAGGDFNGDGRDDVIATFDGTVNSLLITDAATKESQAWYSPLGTQYKSQLSVAAGDRDGDNKADIMLAQIAAFNGQPPVGIVDGSKISFTAFLPTPTIVKPFNLWWATGLTIAARDVDGDGVIDLLAKPTTMLGQSGFSAFKAPTFLNYFFSMVESAVVGNGGPIG